MAQIAKAPAMQPKRTFSSHIIDQGFEGMFGRSLDSGTSLIGNGQVRSR